MVGGGGGEEERGRRGREGGGEEERGRRGRERGGGGFITCGGLFNVDELSNKGQCLWECFSHHLGHIMH